MQYIAVFGRLFQDAEAGERLVDTTHAVLDSCLRGFKTDVNYFQDGINKLIHLVSETRTANHPTTCTLPSDVSSFFDLTSSSGRTSLCRKTRVVVGEFRKLLKYLIRCDDQIMLWFKRNGEDVRKLKFDGVTTLQATLHYTTLHYTTLGYHAS